MRVAVRVLVLFGVPAGEPGDPIPEVVVPGPPRGPIEPAVVGVPVAPAQEEPNEEDDKRLHDEDDEEPEEEDYDADAMRTLASSRRTGAGISAVNVDDSKVDDEDEEDDGGGDEGGGGGGAF